MPKSKLPKVSVVVGDVAVEYSPSDVAQLVKAAGKKGAEDTAQYVAAFALLGARVYEERRADEKAAKKGKGKKA